jgi:hypothetical protein
MPGGKSNFTSNKILDAIYSGGAYVAPAILYCALFTVAPTGAGGGTEVVGGAYARVAVTNDATHFPAAVGQAKSNGTAIVFPAASAAWGTVVAAAFFDDPVAGNMISFGPLAAAQVVAIGNTFQIGVGAFTASEA